MGRGTLTVEDSFDALMGKRRGVSQVHELERLKHLHETAWTLLRDKGLSEEAVQALSNIAALTTPESRGQLRDALQRRVRAIGLVSFATDWKRSLNSLSEDLSTALQDAVVSVFEEKTQSSLSKLQDASNLINNFFLDKEVAWMSGPELKAHMPLIEAVSRAYREALPDDDKSSSIPRMSRKSMADCLGAYASAFLLPLQPWRDELTEEINAGHCDSDLNTLKIALRCQETADVVRQEFLRPVSEAMDRRREVLKQRVSWLTGTSGTLK